ncbi:MAG: DUF4911 domain-containing protein [Deltaproteobacteria bacterium]|nr:DUF4911 domain-containing protein [Deltaproteobacteria bacterium]
MSHPSTTQTYKHILSIEKSEICYLQWIIESYEGMAVMRTIDPMNGTVEISIAPGCTEEILSVIEHLKENGSIHLTEGA